jgi:hypothetical protein
MTQAEFRAALLDPELPQPQGLLDPEGRAAGRRFNVYRNNVTVSLTDALRALFPVIRTLVGDEFFAAMAREFLRAHPPTSPIIFRYGTVFPDFLAGFPPVAHLAYLADVARLEIAIRESYHAADAAPVAPDLLNGIDTEGLPFAHVALAPSLRLVRSDWPVHAIWSANVAGTPPPDHQYHEDVLVMRPAFDPVAQPVTAPEAAFVTALLSGDTLGGAIAAAGPTLDLTQTLTLLFSHKAITGLVIGKLS